MKINSFIKYWLPVFAYLIFTFYLSSLPNPLEQVIQNKELISYLSLQNYTYHLIEYLFLSLLFYRALKITSKSPQTLAILFTVLYAIFDELHQSFVPGRMSSVFDIAVDSFAAIAMQCIINVYQWLKD